MHLMRRRRREEPKEPVTSGLSHTESFVKEITDLLKKQLTAENYKATLQSVLESCKDDYHLNRAGAAAMNLAQKQRQNSEPF